jgi:hypothetical protein
VPRGSADCYKDAVFYEVHVKAFMDADDNAISDFAGLTGRLDYRRDLGVDCSWIRPMYRSPLRDDGDDIANFYGIYPSCGIGPNPLDAVNRDRDAYDQEIEFTMALSVGLGRIAFATKPGFSR